MFEKFDPQGDGKAPLALMLRQHAVFASWQVDLTDQVLSARAAVQRLHRIHNGVYSLVPEPLLTPYGRLMAAVLACGPGAALSHYSAIRHRGLMAFSRPRIDVTVATRSGRCRPGIHVHRSLTLRPQDVELVEGIPCTTLARTTFDAAEVLEPRQLERLLDEAIYREILDADALAEQIEHNRGRASRRTANPAARWLTTGATSGRPGPVGTRCGSLGGRFEPNRSG